MAPNTISTDDFIKAIQHRRTVYPLNDKSPVSDARIEEIVKGVMITTPSSFNTQSGRVVVLLGEQHKKLWDIIREHALPLLQHAGEDVVKMMEQRFAMFKAAYGSVSIRSPKYKFFFKNS